MSVVGGVCLWIPWDERGMEQKWPLVPCPEEMCRGGQELHLHLGVPGRGTTESDLHSEYVNDSGV